ncbi:unnamed protein product [Ectocarpus sp. CCAP 1310/34]|nr:unnamed protein product [Ectocarpus sp. CCAP 1310/34]
MPAAAVAVGASEDGGGKSTTGAGGDDIGVDADGEEAAAGEKASVDGGSGLGDANVRIKAFGTVLEKTLSKTLHRRAPPPGTTPAATTPRPQRAIGEKAAGIAAATSWKPKSKFFRVFLSASTATRRRLSLDRRPALPRRRPRRGRCWECCRRSGPAEKSAAAAAGAHRAAVAKRRPAWAVSWRRSAPAGSEEEAAAAHRTALAKGRPAWAVSWRRSGRRSAAESGTRPASACPH